MHVCLAAARALVADSMGGHMPSSLTGGEPSLPSAGGLHGGREDGEDEERKAAGQQEEELVNYVVTKAARRS